MPKVLPYSLEFHLEAVELLRSSGRMRAPAPARRAHPSSRGSAAGGGDGRPGLGGIRTGRAAVRSRVCCLVVRPGCSNDPMDRARLRLPRALMHSDERDDAPRWSDAGAPIAVTYTGGRPMASSTGGVSSLIIRSACVLAAGVGVVAFSPYKRGSLGPAQLRALQLAVREAPDAV